MNPWKVLLWLLPILFLFLSLLVGRLWIPPGEVFRALIGADGVHRITRTLIVGIRLPRTLAAALIGANLAVAGAAFQGLFRNPLVESKILGVSSGAAFGAALALLWAGGGLAVQGAALGFGLVGALAAYLVAIRFGAGILVLIVAGILISSLFDAFLGFIKYVADPLGTLPAITYWLLGSLGDVRWGSLWPLFVASGVGLPFLLLFRWRLNIFSLDEQEALALGVNVRQGRLLVIFAGTLLTAASVATAGIIGWVGLIVPHAARALAGPDYTRLIPVAISLGASMLLLLDSVARTVLASEIPLGILTGLIGVPVFFVLLARILEKGGGWRSN